MKIEKTLTVTYKDLFPRIGRHSKAIKYTGEYDKGGVYVLWFKDTVMYVGQTKNFHTRNAGHECIHSDWKWNYVSWIVVKNKAERIMIEAMLIDYFQPRYNIACKA